MKLHDLKQILRQYPDSFPRFILPDGDRIPAHFHITDVSHVTKRFIDGGGTPHETTDACLLQTYVADDVDYRLSPDSDLGQRVLQHEDLEVEVEYDCCVVAQYPIAAAPSAGDHLKIRLGEKHTDCLAKQKCGIASPNAQPECIL